MSEVKQKISTQTIVYFSLMALFLTLVGICINTAVNASAENAETSSRVGILETKLEAIDKGINNLNIKFDSITTISVKK